MKKKSHAALFIGFLMASCIIIPIVFLVVTTQLNKQEAKAKSEASLIQNDNASDDSGKTTAESLKDGAQQSTFTTVDASYFDDALFIGDSRTVGLQEYGTLSNATYFANTGLSIYDAVSETVNVDGMGEISLQELLTKNQYGKIYLMLGINELGFDLSQTVSKYNALVGQIKELQPDAIIYIEANLHVTAERSASDDTFNNPNIDNFNAQVSSLADNETVYYLDINELFDDENGALSTDYTNDNAHPLGKYYASWCDWLCEHAIVRS